MFLAAQAPCRALSSHGTGLIVQRAARRAGLPRCGPRELRHSLASGLLASGASLADVGEILRHADPATTANARRFDRLSYLDVLSKDLKVMDASAISLARENRIPILVFSIHNPGAFADAVRGAGRHTIITEEG